MGDEPEEEVPDTPEEDFLGTEMEGLDDLDAIMGDAFAADSQAQPDQQPDLPSRAEQRRPEDSTMDIDAGALEVVTEQLHFFIKCLQSE